MLSSLKKVDELIMQQPKAALALAEDLVAAGEVQWHEMAALGSARRACADYAGARQAFWVAGRIARTLSGGARLAAQLDLARRLSRLHICTGEYDRARVLIEWRVWAERRPVARALAAADLSGLNFIEGRDPEESIRLLDSGINSSREDLKAYAWQVRMSWAIAQSDSKEVFLCLAALGDMALSGVAALHYKWLRALHNRESGKLEEARQQLLAITEELATSGYAAQAGCTLVDAAVCMLKQGDLQAVRLSSGQAFLLLRNIGDPDARKALRLFARAAQQGKLTEQLALELRSRLRRH